MRRPKRTASRSSAGASAGAGKKTVSKKTTSKTTTPKSTASKSTKKASKKVRKEATKKTAGKTASKTTSKTTSKFVHKTARKTGGTARAKAPPARRASAIPATSAAVSPPSEIRIPVKSVTSSSPVRRRLKSDSDWKERPVLIIAGEQSGDLLGGDLVRSLQRSGIRNFLGTGGESMAGAGVDILRRVEDMEVIGFLEALKAYSRLKKLMLEVVKTAQERGVRHVILIDYPGFNLRIARLLHESGMRVFYMVSPQLWAWKYNRIHTIRRYVDVMFTLFPFEEEMYRDEGVPAVCIGHPMVDRIPRQLAEQKPIPSAGSRKTIGLLPGSRGSEIKRLLPDMLEAARRLFQEFPKSRFLLPNINSGLRPFIEEQLASYSDLPIEYLEDRSLRAMEASDLVLIASGTATLETAWFRVPMVIIYRTSAVSFFIAGIVSRVRFVGLANILARKQVAVELLQSEVSPENIYQAAADILSDPAVHREIVAELDQVRRRLGRGNPAGRAAKYITDYIRRDVE